MRGAAKYDLFSKVSMIPDLPFNLVQRVGPLSPSSDADQKFDYSDYFSTRSHFKSYYNDNLHK